MKNEEKMNKTKIKHFNPMKIKGTDTKTGNMFSSFDPDNDWILVELIS